MQEIKGLQIWTTAWEILFANAKSVEEIILIAREENEDSFFDEIHQELETLDKSIHDLEFKNMLSAKDDDKNGILTIHSGAGGTESQDWAEMLMRMYLRWGEKNGFKISIVELLEGDGAGIKSATLEVSGKRCASFSPYLSL